MRPDAKRPPQAPDEAPPPELLRTGWSGGATKFWERGGWDAARSRRLRLVGVSEPWDERKRFWRSASSDACCWCEEGCCIVLKECTPRLRSCS